MAKDVAAMANTRGGLIIFVAQDTTCELTGIDPAEVKPEQYAQWIRNHVHPYLSGLTFTTLTSPDGTRSVLVADVPASPMARTWSTAPPPATRTSRPPSLPTATVSHAPRRPTTPSASSSTTPGRQ
ncbi:ATP-binding protein [Streptomyces sp. BRB040]|uniref:AlbA family DNA-binding domain-containing protein n=1 Tax=Streptomyces sp. BRB040 TaxID=3142634 RepID=UPI0031F665FF